MVECQWYRKRFWFQSCRSWSSSECHPNLDRRPSRARQPIGQWSSPGRRVATLSRRSERGFDRWLARRQRCQDRPRAIAGYRDLREESSSGSSVGQQSRKLNFNRSINHLFNNKRLDIYSYSQLDSGSLIGYRTSGRGIRAHGWWSGHLAGRK